MADDVVIVRKYASEMDAEISRLLLEANEIPAAVLRDSAGGMLPAMSLLFPVRLAVRAEDAERARCLLDDEPLPSEEEELDEEDDDER
jgi:hypothetical protein